MALITSDCDVMRSPSIKRPLSPRVARPPASDNGRYTLMPAGWEGRPLYGRALPAVGQLYQ